MEVSTPGRICLFGEHQDYLGLPVIAMAISLRTKLVGEKRTDQQVIIHMPDIGKTERFSINDTGYQSAREYFKSGINVCKREGLIFSNGFECEIKSDIPIQAGTSSSSAIIVSWINFLSQMSDSEITLSKEKIGELAYKAEVMEFDEPGGMMDQYTTAIGNMIYIESKPDISIQPLDSSLGGFVLGDSGEQKDTLNILAHCRDIRLEIIKKIKNHNPGFDLHSYEQGLEFSIMSNYEKTLFKGTIKNRDLLREAKLELMKQDKDDDYIGSLLNQHHSILRDHLGISTQKIEEMINAASDAGSLGSKINGSGGGGCMFAYAPSNQEAVAEAIESVGGEAYLINVDEGTKIINF
ncbi:MAG: galactokinase family protein [Candidatus Neomarinimicrobiota bacterium]